MDGIENLSYANLARRVFRALGCESELLDCALETYEGFDDPAAPLNYEHLGANLFLQNLYTGPTRAFKDMAMQPFAKILCDLAQKSGKNYLILTATSGDTGPATIEATQGRAHIFTVCMYPKNGTSEVQRRQMTACAAKNIKVLGLEGDFDDAQNTLKNLLNDADFRGFLDARGFFLSATNSVNFGRIIFQIIYHIHAFAFLLKSGAISRSEAIDIVVPSGNFGNALGAFYAKKMGVPIRKIIIATNANCVLYELITRGKYDIAGRKLQKTTSPAMDILKSSNIERVLFYFFGAARTRALMEALEKTGRYELEGAELARLQEDFAAHKCDDKIAAETIQRYAKKGVIIDPHTANALAAADSRDILDSRGVADSNAGLDSPDSRGARACVVCATAEWTKFAPTVKAAIEGGAESGGKSCEKSSDRAALEWVSAHFKRPIHKNIAGLFEKPETNNEVAKKDEVKAALKAWLGGF